MSVKISHHDSLMKAELVNVRFWDLIKIRFPWLMLGLGGALVASFLISRFELSLREHIALAFFIPVIAYMSDAIGTQTETIFVRALTDLKFNITKYILREFMVGAVIGMIVGGLSGFAAYLISGSTDIGYVVGFSLILSMTTATILACLTPLLLTWLKKDPAVGSGPFTTALQDMVSLTLYFLIASMIL